MFNYCIRDCLEVGEEDTAFYTLCLENPLFYPQSPLERPHTRYGYIGLDDYYGLGKFTWASKHPILNIFSLDIIPIFAVM